MLAHHVKQVGCVVAIVGGHVDHVHLLVGLSRTLKVCKLIEVVKSETSKWAEDVVGGNRGFAWQSGYGVFSVSYSNLGEVERYVNNQELLTIKNCTMRSAPIKMSFGYCVKSMGSKLTSVMCGINGQAFGPLGKVTP